MSGRAITDDIGKGKAAFPGSGSTSFVSFHAIWLGEVVPGAKQLDGTDLGIGAAGGQAS